MILSIDDRAKIILLLFLGPISKLIDFKKIKRNCALFESPETFQVLSKKRISDNDNNNLLIKKIRTGTEIDEMEIAAASVCHKVLQL